MKLLRQLHLQILFLWQRLPLIHCITNEISCEMLANGILALGCKPVMADDPREVLDFTKQSQALFINLGHLSAEKEKQSVWQLLMQIKFVFQW